MFKKYITAGISAMALSVIITGPAFADSIRLRSADGSVDVLGQLISFENQLYTVKTAFGPMLFDASHYYCDGSDCPTDAVRPVGFVAPVQAPKNVFVRVN